MRPRDFTPADDVDAPRVAIVNESFELRFFADGGALGRRIRFRGVEAPWLTIVGVVRDIPENGFTGVCPEAVYGRSRRTAGVHQYNRARIGATPLALDVQRAGSRACDRPDLSIYNVNTLRGAVRDATSMTCIFGGVFSTCGFAALVLAAVGLYGVVSFPSASADRELGVRIAVGAKPHNVLGLVPLAAMRQVVIGLAIGAVLAFTLARPLHHRSSPRSR